MARYKSGYDLAEAIERAERASDRRPDTGYTVYEDRDGSYKFIDDDGWVDRCREDIVDPDQFVAYAVGGVIVEDTWTEE